MTQVKLAEIITSDRGCSDVLAKIMLRDKKALPDLNTGGLCFFCEADLLLRPGKRKALRRLVLTECASYAGATDGTVNFSGLD